MSQHQRPAGSDRIDKERLWAVETVYISTSIRNRSPSSGLDRARDLESNLAGWKKTSVLPGASLKD